MAAITKKARFRELFTDHFESGKKDMARLKSKVDSKLEKERHQAQKFRDVSDFAEVNIQTAIRVSYDHEKTLDENFEEFSEQKAKQDESDQVNFLRQPACTKAVDDAQDQSNFWYEMRRGFGNGAKVWMPEKKRTDTGPGAAMAKKPDVPKQHIV